MAHSEPRGFWSNPNGKSKFFPQLILRVTFGILASGILFFGVAHNLPLRFDLKLIAGLILVGMSAVAATMSASFRCCLLLVFPAMFGSRGRGYITVLILTVLYQGPVSNIRQNVEAAAISLGCNLDLQLNHSQLLWRHALLPFKLISEKLQKDETRFQAEAQNIGEKFQKIRDQMVLQYGYDPQPSKGTTQEDFTFKTQQRCTNIVRQGIERCTSWFNQKWTECLATIPVPVIQHIVCASMKFHFLCDIMKVMTPWCEKEIPVEGNFGLHFDRLNLSMDLLSRQFQTKLDLMTEEQAILTGVLLDKEFAEVVQTSLVRLNRTSQQILDILQILLSFTFISMFLQAFCYQRNYKKKIFFDNVYITSSFRKMDARRRKAKKRFVLPLKKKEQHNFIDPQSWKISPLELKPVAAGFFQTFSVSLLCFVVFTADFAISHILEIINRHSVTEFNLTSVHQVEVEVGGTSLLADLLRTTIAAFNVSTELNVDSDNRGCSSPPTFLSSSVHISCFLTVLLLFLFNCMQVFTNRLRRTITASYFPHRETKRILFLYNLQLYKRIYEADRKRTRSQGQKLWRRYRSRAIRWCISHLHRCVRRFFRKNHQASEMNYDPS